MKIKHQCKTVFNFTLRHRGMGVNWRSLNTIAVTALPFSLSSLTHGVSSKQVWSTRVLHLTGCESVCYLAYESGYALLYTQADTVIRSNDFAAIKIHCMGQGCTNPRRHVAQETNVCTVAPNTCAPTYRTCLILQFRGLQF